MDKYYLLVTFGKELESNGNGNEGRRMILKDISGENTYYYGWFGPPRRTLLLFEEEAIEVIKNKLNVYSQGSSQSDFILDCPNVIGEYEGTILFDDNFFDQYGALMYNLVVNNDVPIISSNRHSPQKEVYLILDPSEAPQQKESKVLRTLATGQSDITRHEAYTKAIGLNESNGLVPTYINKKQTLNQMLQIVKKSVPEATQIVLYYPNSLYRASNIYNIGEARLAVAFPNNYIRQIVSNIVSPEGASIANFDTIPVTHSINPESQYKEVRDFDYVIPTVYTGNPGVISSTGSAYDSYAIVSEEDLIALQNLLNNLSNTSMDLYFGVGGK